MQHAGREARFLIPQVLGRVFLAGNLFFAMSRDGEWTCLVGTAATVEVIVQTGDRLCGSPVLRDCDIGRLSKPGLRVGINQSAELAEQDAFMHRWQPNLFLWCGRAAIMDSMINR